MGRRSKLTDADVEAEIAELRKDPYVKLSIKEYAIRERRRKILYDLRWHRKHGIELAESGWKPDPYFDESAIYVYETEAPEL